MGRILSIDLGDIRTGFAVSDPSGFLASGIGTVECESRRKLVDVIINYVNEYTVTEIVLGNPVNMNGTRGERSEKVEAFAERLRESVEVPVVLFDERCTTMAAHRILNATDTRGKKRKNVIDTLSAQIILQNYLDMKRNTVK